MRHSYTHLGHQGRQTSPLDIGELGAFDLTLGDLPEEEKRRRRVFYLRDAIAQLEMGKSLLKGFGCVMIPFFLIPIFWPFIAFFWFMRKKAAATMDQQTRTALAYWGIHEHEVRPPEPRAAPAPPPPPRSVQPVIEVASVEKPKKAQAEKRYRREPWTKGE